MLSIIKTNYQITLSKFTFTLENGTSAIFKKINVVDGLIFSHLSSKTTHLIKRCNYNFAALNEHYHTAQDERCHTTQDECLSSWKSQLCQSNSWRHFYKFNWHIFFLIIKMIGYQQIVVFFNMIGSACFQSPSHAVIMWSCILLGSKEGRQ